LSVEAQNNVEIRVHTYPNSIHASGVSAFSEIEEAVSLGVDERLDSLRVIEPVGERFGSSMPICLRVNPSIMGGAFKISVGHANSEIWNSAAV
jgi:diaminopimelate decarboxylase